MWFRNFNGFQVIFSLGIGFRFRYSGLYCILKFKNNTEYQKIKILLKDKKENWKIKKVRISTRVKKQTWDAGKMNNKNYSSCNKTSQVISIGNSKYYSFYKKVLTET